MSIITGEERKLVGLFCECCNNQVKNSNLISNLWRRFNKELYNIPNRKVEKEWTKFGVAYDSNKKDCFKYFAAIEVTDFEEDSKFEKLLLPKMSFKVFEHRGVVTSLYESVVTAFRVDIPKLKSELSINTDTNISFLEKYDKRFHWTKESSIIEIHIPVVLK